MKLIIVVLACFLLLGCSNDKDTILFVYCKSGNRSKIAAEKLLELGYTVYDLGAYEDINLEE